MLLVSISILHAANPPKTTLNIQGNGAAALVESFIHSLTIEANAAGYNTIKDSGAEDYQIKFTAAFEQAEKKFKFNVSLINAKDSSEIVSMEYFFADEEEMLLYSQLVFFMLMANLPENKKAALEDNALEDKALEDAALEDDAWRNKWLYINTSFDYSLTLYPDGNVNSLAHMLGAGLGLEFQFLNFMSFEPHAQLSFEQEIIGQLKLKLLLAVELKFPLKFLKYIIIQPYGIAAYPMFFLNGNEISSNYPEYIFGGGIQAAVKAGKSSALFFEVSYMYLGNIGVNNELYPDLSFKVGLKSGFLNRKY